MDANTSSAEQKIGAFAESMQRRIERAIRALPDIELDADSTPAERRIQELRRELETLSGQRIGIDIDAGTAQAKIERIRGELTRLGSESPNIQVQADTARASAALGAVSAQAARLDGNQVNITVSARDAVHTISMLGLIAAGLGVVATAGVAAAGALVAVTGVGLVAASGVSALVAGFSGVGSAVKALRQEETKAAAGTAQSASSRVNSAQAIVGAQRAVEDAVTRAHRAEITGAQQVEDAVESVKDAEKDWADAQGDFTLAQEELTRARAEAREEVEDLALSLRDAHLDEREATIRLAEAQEELALAREKGLTGRDIEKAELKADKAALALDKAVERRGDLTAEQAKADRVGVEGSDRVVSANRRVADAADRVSAAEKRVDQAREQADRARQQAFWAQQDATRAIEDAQRSLGNAYADTGASGAAAGNKVKEALHGLSPETQSFARMLVGEVIPGLEKVRDKVQAALLPKLETSFRNLAGLGPEVTDGLEGTANVLGDLAIKGSEMMSSGPFRADTVTIMARNNRVLGDFGDAGLDLIDMIRNLTVSSGPMLERFSQFVERGAESAAVFLENKRATGELDDFFDKAGDTLAVFGDILGDIVVGGTQLALTMGPLGILLLRQIADLVAWVGQLAQAHPELTRLVGALLIGAAAFSRVGTVIGGVSVLIPALLGNWSKLIGVVGGLSPAGVAAGAAMTRITAGMQSASLAAGVYTERLTGSANAGEKAALAGDKVTNAVTKVGSALPLIGAVLIGGALAWDGMTTSASEAATALLAGGRAAAEMRAELAAGDAEADRVGFGYGVFRTKLSDATDEVNRLRMAQDPLTRATHDAARAQKDYLFALESGNMPAAEDAYRRFTTATEEQARQQRILDGDLKATTRSLEEQIGVVLGAVEADIRYRDAIDRATQAIQENGVTHDLNTESGRRNQQALIDLSRAADANMEAMRTNGASADEMRRFHDSARQEMTRQAQQMGFNQGEAQKLADKYLGIRNIGPITNDFLANTFPAFDAVLRLKGDINRMMTEISDQKVVVSFVGGGAPNDTGNILNRAHGGAVFGPGTETSDSIPVRMSTNEHVWTGREVRGAGGHGNVVRIRQLAATGRLPRFAEGGFVREQMVSDYAAAGLLDVARRNAQFIKDNFPAGGDALNFARSQAGKPYIWAGVGPAGYDCSGFMSSITRVMRGQTPHARVGATASFPWSGFKPGTGGVFSIGSTANAGGGIGHMAGTLFGTNVESRGSDGVVVGPRARGATDKLFTTRASFVMDQGGIMWPGTVGENRGSRPERVLSPRQTEAFERMVDALTTRVGAGPVKFPTAGGAGGGADWPTLIPVLRAALSSAMERVFAGGLRTDVDYDGLTLRLNRVAAINRRR